MSRLWKIGLSALAIAVATGAGPAVGQAPAARWEPMETKQACAARQGAVMIGTPDGKRFALFVTGARVADQPMRSVMVDGKPLLLTFSQAGGSAMADLDPATLGAIAAGARLTIDWPEGKADIATEGLLPALQATTACGARLDQQRLAQAQRRERARRASHDLDDFMATMPGPPPIPGMSQGTGVQTHPTAMQGAMCFKKWERTSGFNKLCAYDCMGSESVQTIGNAELCPATMRSPR